ncbi:NAD(P)H-binding protein [Euzebyella saccharophila]|uniref:NAD(P)H-binding protein n=1 Tax=Euzebyella saccharophila TaxID=679664 RepID=A0ABV8JV54_9FLAO|nr:NAD(P)H-binding protein [Euzebyella saccharophila]
MEEEKKTAIVLGATGLTGGKLLKLLLADNRYQKVKLFSRSSVEIQHVKLEEHLGDLMNLSSFKEDFMGQEVFCCIGTTKAKTPNNALYEKIDYGIPVEAAKLCVENQIPTFVVVSALGADAKSKIFYNRIKGQMEEAVLQQQIKNTYILQPSLIGGNRQEKRLGEWLFKQLMKIGNLLLVGGLKKYRSIEPDSIAQCMLWVANNDYPNGKIESDKIKVLAKQ